MYCFIGKFYLYRNAHTFQCVKWFLLDFVGRAHWRTACSAAGCQGLTRVDSEVRSEIQTSIRRCSSVLEGASKVISSVYAIKLCFFASNLQTAFTSRVGFMTSLKKQILIKRIGERNTSMLRTGTNLPLISNLTVEINTNE